MGWAKLWLPCKVAMAWSALQESKCFMSELSFDWHACTVKHFNPFTGVCVIRCSSNQARQVGQHSRCRFAKLSSQCSVGIGSHPEARGAGLGGLVNADIIAKSHRHATFSLNQW